MYVYMSRQLTSTDANAGGYPDAPPPSAAEPDARAVTASARIGRAQAAVGGCFGTRIVRRVPSLPICVKRSSSETRPRRSCETVRPGQVTRTSSKACAAIGVQVALPE